MLLHRLLAADGAGAVASVALVEEGRVRDVVAAPAGVGAADALPGLLVGLAGRHGLALLAIDALAVSLGPGGFTGVRSAVALARAMRLANGARVWGVTWFEAALERLRAEGGEAALRRPALILRDVGRGQLLAQGFTAGGAARGTPFRTDRTAAAAQAAHDDAVLGGDLGVGDAEAAGGGNDAGADVATGEMPGAGWVALAAWRHAAAGVAPTENLLPFYPRPPDARPGAGASLLAMPAP